MKNPLFTAILIILIIGSAKAQDTSQVPIHGIKIGSHYIDSNENPIWLKWIGESDLACKRIAIADSTWEDNDYSLFVWPTDGPDKLNVFRGKRVTDSIAIDYLMKANYQHMETSYANLADQEKNNQLLLEKKIKNLQAQVAILMGLLKNQNKK